MRNQYRRIVLIGMVLGLMSGSSACQVSVNTQSTVDSKGEKTSMVEGTSETTAEGLLPINSMEDGVVVDDLLEAVTFLGLTPAEIRIPVAVMSGCKTILEGRLFETEEYASLYFNEETERAEKMWIHVSGEAFDYEEVKERLREQYGEIVDESESPYALVNGGAVLSCVFETEELKVVLKSASERPYMEIEIEPMQ